MPFINFKEEVTVAKEQLEKRLENNSVLCKRIPRDKSIVGVVPDDKYSFRVFEDKIFNNELIQEEDKFLQLKNLNIVCTTFNKCKFFNMKFQNCTFIGCRFKECEFGGGGVIFENCTFLLEQIKQVPSLNKKDNLACEFDKCKLYCKFTGSNLGYISIKKCNVEKTTFQFTDMSNVIIIDSLMKKICIGDSDLSGAKIINTYLVDFDFVDKDKTKFNEKTFIDKIEPREKTKKEYEGLYMVYETIADKFRENNLKNNFGEYYFICKNMQRKSLDKISTKFTSFIYYVTCGYGERMGNSLITSVFIILLFTILYLLVGVDIEGEIISYILGQGPLLNSCDFLRVFNEALNLSCGIFAGLGSITSCPTETAYMIANIEMVLGFIMMGIGVGTITRKLVR